MLIRFIYKFINIGVFISLTPRSAEDKIKTALRNNNGNEIIIKYKDAVARIALSPFSHAGKYGAIITQITVKTIPTIKVKNNAC